MDPSHALVPFRSDRHRLAVLLAVLLMCLAGTAHAASDCNEDIGTSLGAEPAWNADCVALRPPRLEPPAPFTKSGTDIAYALDVSPVSDNLFTHTLNNFPDQSVVGPLSLTIVGIDFDENASTLYALDEGANELGTINLSTGAFTAIGSSVPTIGDWTGLAIDPDDGTMFASAADLGGSSLYTINRATGAATLVGSDSSIGAIVDIAINCDGVIYGHDILSDSIFRINRNTGLGTFVGNTGIDSNFAQGMDFDNDTGVLYAWTYQGLGANRYGTINLANGMLTALSIDDPFGQFEGAIQNTCEDEGDPPGLIFDDDFESGNTAEWSGSVQ